MSFKVISPGMLSTVQDSGRFGYQKFGFSPSGIMDTRSYNIANALVGNFTDEAVIEMTMAGGKFLFLEDSYIAITGADMNAKIDGEPVETYKTLFVKQDSTLSFSTAKSGMRTYIAIAGGVDVEREMGSRSTNLLSGIGGCKGRKLNSGDVLLSGKSNKSNNIRIHKVKSEDFSSGIKKIRVVLGPQDDYFTEKGIDTFLNSEFKVTNNSDRMGYKLEGQKIECKDKVDIISDGIVFGSVQVPSNGQPIVMLADRQTTGGYAKIATVISADLPVLVQSKPGDIITFFKVTRDQAEKIYRQSYKEYEKMLISF